MPVHALISDLGGGGGGGSVTSVGGTGSVSGLTLTGTVTSAGDLTLGGALSIVVNDLPAAGVSPGTYGSASAVAQFTVDGKGRVTAAGNVPIVTKPGGVFPISVAGLAGGSLEWTETGSAPGLVTGNRVSVSLAPSVDADENSPEMLDVSSLSGVCLSNDTLTVTACFATPTRGLIPLFYGVV